MPPSLNRSTLGALAHRVDRIAICALAVVACTVALLARDRGSRTPLAQELGEVAGARVAEPGVAADGPVLAAYVVFQLADCDGNLRVLRLLQRRTLRDRVPLAGLAFVGSDAELDRARGRLPAAARSLPIRRATGSLVSLLARLGHRATPIVVVLDAEQRVRFVTGVPRSPRAYVGLARVLSTLEAADAP